VPLPPKRALDLRKKAMLYLLVDGDGQFCRSLEWFEQKNTNVPTGIWSLLLQEGFVDCFAPGGPAWRLTVTGWIEACRLLRTEVDLDVRFGKLAAHLKGLNSREEILAESHTGQIAAATGLPERWVFDAIDGQMAETVFGKHGASLADRMGGVEIPGCIGNSL